MARCKKQAEYPPGFDKELQAAYGRHAEELHNAVVEVLVEQKADVYTILFVLEMIRYGVVSQKYQELLGQ